MQGLGVAPTSRQRLGYFTVACLIFNRVIGVGIFLPSSSILAPMGNLNVLIALGTAMLVFVKLGITVPRFYEARVIEIPRSGGEMSFVRDLIHSFRATFWFLLINWFG